jgi:Transposase DDE domain group 1
VRLSRPQVVAPVHAIPELRFEDQRLTSFSGLVIFQALFQRLRLKERLAAVLANARTVAYRPQNLVMMLVVHLLLGFRRLRERDFYRDDPMVQRVLGLHRLPDVSTWTRGLAEMTPSDIAGVRKVNREVVTDRVRAEKIQRVTIDFDGSVLSTRGHAEGTAIGFNRQRKGARSYYPLFSTIAQTGQFLDMLHRPGNVHDSHDALAFIEANIEIVRGIVGVREIETRMDGAFFSEDIAKKLVDLKVRFSISLPFERFPQLKKLIEDRKTWYRIDRTWSFADLNWAPKSWDGAFRVLAIRRKTPKPRKGPLQLDLFQPRDYEFDFRVILTNKVMDDAAAVMDFHHGRGSQEGVIGEAKACTQLDYIPSRKLAVNQTFTLSAMLAHNLGRELQMSAEDRKRSDTTNRAARWVFKTLHTLRHVVLRAGRLTRPEGKLTLTMSGNSEVRDQVQRYVRAVHAA